MFESLQIAIRVEAENLQTCCWSISDGRPSFAGRVIVRRRCYPPGLPDALMRRWTSGRGEGGLLLALVEGSRLFSLVDELVSTEPCSGERLAEPG